MLSESAAQPLYGSVLLISPNISRNRKNNDKQTVQISYLTFHEISHCLCSILGSQVVRLSFDTWQR